MALIDRIFAIGSATDFHRACLDVFAYQASHCVVYAEYLTLLNRKPETIESVADIPFLPIEFFKKHRVISAAQSPQLVFRSSGTTGSIQSKHHVVDLTVYERSFRASFEQFYGS